MSRESEISLIPTHCGLKKASVLIGEALHFRICNVHRPHVWDIILNSYLHMYMYFPYYLYYKVMSLDQTINVSCIV